MDEARKKAYPAGITKEPPKKDFSQLSKEYGEGRYRQDLLEKIEMLKGKFNTLENSGSLDKVKKQMVLGRGRKTI